MNTPIDSVLLVSFGGPEGPDDVLPFLHNVTRGRNVPQERLAVVAQQYLRFDGVSPINGQNRALMVALQGELDNAGVNLPVYWGNRNWHPFVADTLALMAADGRHHALAFVTSAYSSYSGCRQYQENIEQAQAQVGIDAPAVTKLRQFYNHPGFLQPIIDNTRTALDKLGSSARLVFTAHSLPLNMATACRYEQQLRTVAHLVAASVDVAGGGSGEWEWDLAFQSRSGAPGQPWLGPDILEHLESLHDAGINNVVVIPIGFISDHMEVVYDLDVLAAERAAELGMRLVRVATPGTDHRFVAMIRELIQEQLGSPSSRATPKWMGDDGPVGCLSSRCCLPSVATAAVGATARE